MAAANQDTVYQSMYQQGENSEKKPFRPGVGRSPSDTSQMKAPAVRRRESNRAKQNVKQRLSNIISWYIPDNNEEEQVMLNIPEENEDVEAGGNEPNNALFQVKNLLNLEQLLPRDSSILSVCFKEGHIYISISGKSSVTSFPLKKSANSMKEIPLRLGKTELFPEYISFNEDNLFVAGYFIKQETKMYVLAKFHNGVVVSRTKAYPYPYFKHFSFDNDGNIIVCSPETGEGQTSAKVFKLSPDFSRKSYFIKLGNQRVVYRPEFVASHTAGERGWISVRVEPQTDKENLDSRKQRRLISFTCCKPETLLKPVETKEWLKVESWNFEMVTPGMIMAFDKRLLVIDDILGNLHFLDLNSEGKPIIKPISKSGATRFIGMTCSNEAAYLFSEKTIFEFKFKVNESTAPNPYAII